MDDILNNFRNLKINNNNICILCNNLYNKFYYNNNDLLCFKCNSNYEEFINENINNDDGSIIL
jgi:hypothetical protein